MAGVDADGARVWAIGDMHWSTRRPMSRFGSVWENHRERMCVAWRQRVGRGDMVLVPGDLSFATDIPHRDLAEINALPGQKVFVPGNHDRWTEGIGKTKLAEALEAYPTLHMLSFAKPYYETGQYLIVGYKGSEPPEVESRHTQRRHRKTLEHARRCVKAVEHVIASYHKVIVMTHYAPSLEEREILSALSPALWVHGHAHLGGDDEHLVRAWHRERVDPCQRCVSSDYLDQIPLEITGGVIHPHI